MKRFTLRIPDELDKMIEIYMSKNKIISKNEAIVNIIEMLLKDGANIISLKEVDKKMERILKLESLNNSLIEQLFCNHGFPMNLNKKEDLMLKELYESIRKKYIMFVD